MVMNCWTYWENKVVHTFAIEIYAPAEGEEPSWTLSGWPWGVNDGALDRGCGEAEARK